ncbi:hypothetical protein GOD62_29345 [Sinorhizobium medicae]|nr:hypothetical protein [Sinorhizobium medicae]MDX0796699.1 hypothetical protein [Sinorhizobium medicae]
MTVYRGKQKCLRSWLVSTAEAANALRLSEFAFRYLVDEGFIQPAARKGFYRMGAILDGYAEAIRIGRIAPPYEPPRRHAGQRKSASCAGI